MTWSLKKGWKKTAILKEFSKYYNLGQTFLDLQAGKTYFIPSPPTQCCFMGFSTVRQALFAQHDSIDNIDLWFPNHWILDQVFQQFCPRL